MGCDFKGNYTAPYPISETNITIFNTYIAYWVGTFTADYLLLLIPLFVMWITWAPAGMSDYYSGKQGLVFFLFLLFDCQLIAFAYATSYMFKSPKSCIAFL